MENVESQARPQTVIRHPKLAMVSMLLGAFVGMSPAQTAALNALSGREAVKHRPTSRRRPGNGFGDLVPGIGSARGEWFGPSLLYGRGPHRLLLYLGLDWHCAGGRDPIKGAASGALD